MHRRAKRLILAMGIGLLATGGILHWSSSASSPRPELAAVVVAAAHVPAGTLLEAKHLHVQRLPAAAAPPGALHAIEPLVGKRARWDLLPGDPIVEAKLTSADSPVTIPKGKRALSLKVADADVEARLIQPGMRVDAIAAWEGAGDPQSRTVAQYLPVLSVHVPEGRRDGRGVPTVTLAVTPQEAERILLASDRGTVRLVARSPEEPAPHTPPDERTHADPAASPQTPRVTPKRQVAQRQVAQRQIPPEDSGAVVLIRGSRTSDLSSL